MSYFFKWYKTRSKARDKNKVEINSIVALKLIFLALECAMLSEYVRYIVQHFSLYRIMKYQRLLTENISVLVQLLNLCLLFLDLTRPTFQLWYICWALFGLIRHYTSFKWRENAREQQRRADPQSRELTISLKTRARSTCA